MLKTFNQIVSQTILVGTEENILYLHIWQLIFILIVASIFWDFIRILVFKLMSKRIRLFALVPDTEQTRISFVSKKLGVSPADIIIEKNVYYDVNHPETRYVLDIQGAYVLENEEDYLKRLEESKNK